MNSEENQNTAEVVTAKEVPAEENSVEENSVEESSEVNHEENGQQKASDSQEENKEVDASEEVNNKEEEVKEEKPRHPDLAWYVVNAYSGYESKVKLALEERIRTNGMDSLFGDIQVPQETVVELVKGQKKTSNRKFFPGYVLIEMVLNQDTWHLIKETPKVSGFVGDKTNPVPLSIDEVNRILNQVEEGAASPAAKIKFEEGETVKVTDGPFSDFNGTVEEVNQQKGKLKVLISIFGRATPVELDFVQVEKLQKI